MDNLQNFRKLFEGFFINSSKRVRLRELNISNYRSFKDNVKIKNRPLTLIFGGNSAGKSSLLQLFNYLENAAKSETWNINDTVNLKDIVYQKKAKNTISLTYLVSHTFESDISYEGQTKHQANYKVSVELELNSIENSLDSAISLSNKFKPLSDTANHPKLRKAKIEDFKRRYMQLNEANRFEFIEKKIVVEEYLNVFDRKKSKIILDLSFNIRDNEVYLHKGYINPASPLALTNLSFPDQENMRRRIKNNVDGMADNYLNSFYDFCQFYKKIKFDNIELYQIGSKSKLFSLVQRPNRNFISDVFQPTGIGLFSSVKGVFNHTAQYLGHTGKKQNKIILPEGNLSKTPKLSVRRKERGFFKRTAMFNGAFLSNIQDILEAPFRNINGLYVGGIREVLSEFSDFEAFCGILKNEDTQKKDDVLPTINKKLGNKGLGTNYQIKYSRGVNDKEISNLQRKLKKRGFDWGYLYKGLKESGLVHKYELFDTITNTSVKKSEVGLGIIQVLPIISNMAAHENALLVIEQPELHLHPAQQSKLAQLVVENHLSNGNRFMIETHSEHFIKTVQLEIARSTSKRKETDGIGKEDIQVLFVDRDEEKNGSYVREIKLKDDGSFSEPWPDNFFDVSADITLERLRLTNRN